MTESLDVEGNRSAAKYTPAILAARCLWTGGIILFRLIPRPLFGIRSALLRLFGAKIGAKVHIYPSATIYFPWNLSIDDQSSIGEHAVVYNLGAITIGKRATISQRSHLCGGSHDYNDPKMPLLKLPIAIGDDAWICADAFVGPGVTVGRGAVVGARAVVMKDVRPWSVVAGNPAIQVRSRRLENQQK